MQINSGIIFKRKRSHMRIRENLKAVFSAFCRRQTRPQQQALAPMAHVEEAYMPPSADEVPSCQYSMPGVKRWLIRGYLLHRLDGPAIESRQGQQWFYLGQLHREGAPAVTGYDKGEQWYRHGKRHREDGPAWIYPNGYVYWMQNDRLHRLDGPAKISPEGRESFYIHGTELSAEDFKKETLRRWMTVGKPAPAAAAPAKFRLKE